MSRKKTRAEQLQNYRVNEVTGCHEWTKCCRKVDGYGEFFQAGKKWSAHRAAYIEYKGDIPKGLGVLHSCDNPKCINPAHLRLGTDRDNVDDKMARGRHRTDDVQYWRDRLSEDDIRRMVAMFNQGVSPHQIIKEYRLNWRGWHVVKQAM